MTGATWWDLIGGIPVSVVIGGARYQTMNWDIDRDSACRRESNGWELIPMQAANDSRHIKPSQFSLRHVFISKTDQIPTPTVRYTGIKRGSGVKFQLARFAW
jgi:hypothetical protein